MKKYLALILIIFFNFSLQKIFAQKEPVTKDSLNKRIENYIKEKNYTRIPNADFEIILKNEVESEVKDQLTIWITWICIIISAIGGLSAYAFNIKIKQVVGEQIKSQTEATLANINKYIIDSKKYTLRSDLEVIKKKFEINPASELNIVESKKILNEAIELKNRELVSDIIDFLTLIYYNHRLPNEIEKLIEQNSDKCEIQETTYMSAAILLADFYEADGSVIYKNNCTKYCNVSINKVPYYGEPYAVMLYLYAIDFVNAKYPAEKNKIKSEIVGFIDAILKGSSHLTAYNTYLRIEKDKAAMDIFSSYILTLEKEIPESINEFYARAKDYEDRIKKPLKN